MSLSQAKRTEEGPTRMPPHPVRPEENKMAELGRLRYLRIALLLVGVIFIVGIYPLTIIWPSGWSWHTGQTPITCK